MQTGKMRLESTHPSPACDGSNLLRAICGDRPVEGSEQVTAGCCIVMVGGTDEFQERDVGKSRRLLHEPSFAAHRDAIAWRK